jgi:hypothetical protein
VIARGAAAELRAIVAKEEREAGSQILHKKTWLSTPSCQSPFFGKQSFRHLWHFIWIFVLRRLRF